MSHTTNGGGSDGRNSSVGRSDHIGLFFLLIQKNGWQGDTGPVSDTGTASQLLP